MKREMKGAKWVKKGREITGGKGNERKWEIKRKNEEGKKKQQKQRK